MPLRRLRAAAYDIAMLPAEHGRVGGWRHGLLALAVLALAGVVHVTAMREARALTAARPAA